MSYIPKPYVGLGSGNETRDCTDTQYEAVNGLPNVTYVPYSPLPVVRERESESK